MFTIHILSQTFFFFFKLFSELKLKLTWSYHNITESVEGRRTAPLRGTPAATAPTEERAGSQVTDHTSCWAQPGCLCAFSPEYEEFVAAQSYFL